MLRKQQMQKKRDIRNRTWWKKKYYHADLMFFVKVSVVLMIITQLLIQYNNSRVDWKKERVSNIVVDETNSSDLIIAVDSKTGKAGAINYNGDVVIPFTSSTFDPWTGSLINDGLYHNGNLYWIVEDRKVGIVNENNEEVIPKEYGYLKLAQEDQFIAGNGTLTQAMGVGGSYAYQKYGVITESQETIIPIEYESLELNEDGTYTGEITEGKYKITRIFQKNGEIRKETRKQVAADSDEEINEEDETQSETEASQAETTSVAATQEEGLLPTVTVAKEEIETGGIEDIETETEPDEVIITKVYSGGDREIYFDQGICTLRVAENEVNIFEFPGERIVDVDVPQFINNSKLIQDVRDDGTYIYSAKNADLLCVVSSELNYSFRGDLIVYEDGGDYVVKNLDNRELYRVAKGEKDQFMNSPKEKPRFIFQNDYFVYQSDTDRTLITNKGIVIASNLDVITYNSESSEKDDDTEKIFICQRGDKYAAFNAIGDKILDFNYKKIEFFTGHTDELRVTKTNGKMGIVNYKGQAIIPLEFDNVGYGQDVSGASKDSIETYILLSEQGQGNKYFGQDGNEIYYLDMEGNKIKRVQYVVKEEKSSIITDIFMIGNQLESPIIYRITGNQKIMDNAYGTGIGYRRCQVEEHLSSNGITFLLIDSMTNRIGVYDYTYGETTLMGYQETFWAIWAVLTWICVISLILIVATGLQFGNLVKSVKIRFHFID